METDSEALSNRLILCGRLFGKIYNTVFHLLSVPGMLEKSRRTLILLPVLIFTLTIPVESSFIEIRLPWRTCFTVRVY